MESLRDLAIKHNPDAAEMRRRYVKSGLHYADAGLQAAATSFNPTWTAIEKQAAELLILTFSHHAALPMLPIELNPVEHADFIAELEQSKKDAVEAAPKIEAGMLEAARLLCELTGDQLPPWANALTATEQPAKNVVGTRHDPLADVLVKIYQALEQQQKSVTYGNVIKMLREMVGKKGACIKEVASDDVVWENSEGELESLTKNSLKGRIYRWNKRAR